MVFGWYISHCLCQTPLYSHLQLACVDDIQLACADNISWHVLMTFILLEELRLLVVAMVGRKQGGCTSSSGGGTVDDKVGKDTRDARESSPQPGRKLRGGKVTGRRETVRKETGRKGTGGKTTGVKERGVGETGGKEKGVGEMGGKTTGVKERGVVETRAKEREVRETGAKETGGKGSGQNVMEGIEQKSYSAVVIEGVRKRARVFVGDSIVRKTDRVLNKRDEALWCKIVSGNSKLTIGLIYRSPNINEEDNTKIKTAIKEVSKGECIIMGDFNHGHIQWNSLESTGSEDQQFLFLIQDSFLTQHVLEPTRGENVLDIISGQCKNT